MFRIIGTSYIRKNFIDNYHSDYEEYLTEFVNESRFISDHGNDKFVHNKKQPNGEPDIYNKEYTLDYKLLMDKKTMENLTYYSSNIAIYDDGVRIYSASKRQGEYINYIFPQIIKKMPLDKLIEL